MSFKHEFHHYLKPYYLPFSLEPVKPYAIQQYNNDSFYKPFLWSVNPYLAIFGVGGFKDSTKPNRYRKIEFHSVGLPRNKFQPVLAGFVPASLFIHSSKRTIHSINHISILNLQWHVSVWGTLVVAPVIKSGHPWYRLSHLCF